MTAYRLFSAVLALLAVFTFSSVSPPGSDQTESFTMEFFAQPLRIDFAPEMKISKPQQSLDERMIDRVLRDLNSRNTETLLTNLLDHKATLQLNDFLFYKLAQKSIAVIYGGKESAARELTLYQLLASAGFDVRLTFKGHKAYVNVYTEEELFEVPIIQDNHRSYANISCMNGECNGKQRLFIYQKQPNPNGRSFSFQLNSWPTLQAQPVNKPLRFNFRNEALELDIVYDKTMVDIMEHYPFIHEYAYLDTPLSPTLQKSLLPKLRYLMKPLSEREQLELLVSFTRSAFAYKEDNAYFGRSKPMVPEELFSYAYSDCEDRSALFFALVKELMGKSMAVIAYEDHLTIAVESADIAGDFFNYEGRRYIFCDPTGPKGSSRIGQIPPGYENKSFEIIGQHK